MKNSWLLSLLVLAQSVQALPRLTDLNQLGDIDSNQKVSSRLLRDHLAADTFYVTPAYVDVASDRSTGDLLFKLSLSQTEGSGELSSVLKLAFDQDSIAADWQKQKALNPNISLKKIPIFAGKFGIELETPEFAMLIGRSESVLSDLENGQIPLSIEIHPEGIELLRALNSTANSTIMFLNFAYSSRFYIDSQPISTTVLLADLLRDMETDRFLTEAWDQDLLPSQDAVETYFIRKYQQSWFTFGQGQPIVRVLAKLLTAQLQTELTRLVARPIDFKLKTDIQLLRARIAAGTLAGSLQMKLVGEGEERVVENSVALAFRNVCERYANRVYIEETGASQCFDLDVIGTDPDDDDDVWVPFETIFHP